MVKINGLGRRSIGRGSGAGELVTGFLSFLFFSICLFSFLCNGMGNFLYISYIFFLSSKKRKCQMSNV